NNNRGGRLPIAAPSRYIARRKKRAELCERSLKSGPNNAVHLSYTLNNSSCRKAAGEGIPMSLQR
ncbi:hypothetical protein ACOYYH_23525, partial [Escherichia coli]